jgi:hypothetical protein
LLGGGHPAPPPQLGLRAAFDEQCQLWYDPETFFYATDEGVRFSFDWDERCFVQVDEGWATVPNGKRRRYKPRPQGPRAVLSPSEGATRLLRDARLAIDSPQDAAKNRAHVPWRELQPKARRALHALPREALGAPSLAEREALETTAAPSPKDREAIEAAATPSSVGELEDAAVAEAAAVVEPRRSAAVAEPRRSLAERVNARKSQELPHTEILDALA